MAGKRKTPRAPLLTQVEAQGGQAGTLGRTSDISVGGLLIETPDTLEIGATVVVRFFVPPEKTPIEAAGRVVRCEPGKCMAVAFLGLPDAHRRRIVDYIQKIQGEPAETALLEAPAGTPRQRRSARIPRRVAVVLSWQDETGRPKQEAAETQLLSRYGAQVLAFSELKAGQLVRMSVPDTGKEGLSRIVYSAISVTTPAPTVRPPSRIANRSSLSIAIGVISVTSIATLSPGITISTPAGSAMSPVTSVVRK